MAIDLQARGYNVSLLQPEAPVGKPNLEYKGTGVTIIEVPTMTQEFLNSLLPPEVESVTVDKYYKMANLFFERLKKYTDNEAFI